VMLNPEFMMTPSTAKGRGRAIMRGAAMTG
jgi:hypothetical protein